MKTLLSQSLCGWPAPWDLGGQIKGNPWFGKQRNPQGQQIPRIRAEAGGVSEDRGPVTAPFPPHCPCFSWLSGWKWTIDLLDLWTGGRIWGLYWAPDSGIYCSSRSAATKTWPEKRQAVLDNNFPIFYYCSSYYQLFRIKKTNKVFVISLRLPATGCPLSPWVTLPSFLQEAPTDQVISLPPSWPSSWISEIIPQVGPALSRCEYLKPVRW